MYCIVFLGVCPRASINWHSPALGCPIELSLLGPEGITEAGEIVYLPDGVTRGDGPELSTNHLVPFAAVGDEAAFCFDVTQGPDYPVYYHHQDALSRARIKETGEWEPEAVTQTDFQNFAAWMSWLTDALTRAADPDGLGQPQDSLPALDFGGCSADDCRCEFKYKE